MPSNPSSDPRGAKDPSALPVAVPANSDTLAKLGLQPGARPHPSYELIRKLGEGGFGEVWHARGIGVVDAALKFIRLDASGSSLELRSLEVMKSIRHPNLVSLFGAWQTDNMLILAMELCDRSLADRLKEALEQRLPGIPPKELLKYVRGAAEGLDALADHNVQHRDVKPGNLLLLYKGVKVADFGLAKVLDQNISTKSAAYSPAYTAPECIKGTIARQSDQYSLAMTYYHLRTGQLLFNGTCDHILYCHMEEQPNLTALPAAERPIMARALAKEPEARWKNCATFVNELIKAYNLKPVPLAKVAPQHEGQRLPKEAELLAQATIMPPSPPAAKRSPLWSLAVAALLTLSMSFLIVVFLITSLAPDLIARFFGGETVVCVFVMVIVLFAGGIFSSLGLLAGKLVATALESKQGPSWLLLPSLLPFTLLGGGPLVHWLAPEIEEVILHHVPDLESRSSHTVLTVVQHLGVVLCGVGAIGALILAVVLVLSTGVKRRVVGLGLAILVTAAMGFYFFGGANAKLTAENFEAVKKGMTLKEIEDVLGPGQPTTAKDVTRAYHFAPRDERQDVVKSHQPYIDAGKDYFWKNGDTTVFVLFDGPAANGGVVLSKESVENLDEHARSVRPSTKK